ncbi:MAG: chaperone NapD, partial [Sulfuritalea sp.]|nr:chaperone NapD [Sulfuritalea sp.]
MGFIEARCGSRAAVPAIWSSAMNISSAIVHASPGQIALVKSGISGLNGVEIHAISP